VVTIDHLNNLLANRKALPMRRARTSNLLRFPTPVNVAGRIGVGGIAAVFAAAMVSGSAIADASLPADAVILTTIEVREAFANVKDEAEVQDAAGTRAVNYWYSNGTFTNRWRNATASGEVTGRWWAEDNKRCVEITSGLPEREGKVRCAPVYRLGDVYYSIEQDGRVHGAHRLSPID
jgi:hypothetical protein